MIGLTRLEAYNSTFSKTYEKFISEFYTDLVYKFSLTELQDELREILDIPINSTEHLQDVIMGPRVFEAYKKLESEKRPTDILFMF